MASTGPDQLYHQSGTSAGLPLTLPRLSITGDSPAATLPHQGSSRLSSPPSQPRWSSPAAAEGLQSVPDRRVSRVLEPVVGTPRRPMRYRFLTANEWALLAHAVGGVRDSEGHAPIHPTSGWWPPRGMPSGLYRDVVAHRSKFFYLFHALSLVRWVSMVLQLSIGATLTAIGSMSDLHGLPITILAAANTVNAGIVGLLHNSGLPERYRSDQVEFSAVEDYIRQLLDAGLIDDTRSVDEVIAECFDRYQDAKATVQANFPASYTPSRRTDFIAGQPEVPAAGPSVEKPTPDPHLATPPVPAGHQPPHPPVPHQS